MREMSQRHMLLRFALVAGLLSLGIGFTQGQNLKLIDSLKQALTYLPEGKQFEVLNTIGFEYRYSYPDSTIHYCKRAYDLGTKVHLPRMLARPLSFIGLALTNQGDYKSALDYHNRSIEVAIEQSDTFQLAHSYNNVGRIFFDQGDLVRAYSNFVRAKQFFENLGDKPGLAYVYRSLADLFTAKGDFAKALENSQMALSLRKELGDPRAITSAYMSLGLLYEEMDTVPLALKQFRSADSIASAVSDRVTKAELAVGIAEIYFHDNRIDETISLAHEVLTSVSETTNQKIYMRARLLMAKCMMVKGNDDMALAILNRCYQSAETSGNLVFQREAAQLLTQAYSKRKSFSKAKEFSDIYQILRERIQNADLNKEIERLQFQLQIEKAESLNETLKARQVQDEALIARQRSQNILLALAGSFVAVMAIFMWMVNRKRKLTNRKLEDQNLHILQQREEIAKQNEILSRSNRDLDKLNHEKDTLMNIVAHDLKAPLNRISGLVSILEIEGNLNSTQNDYIRWIKESTRGGLDLITGLLDVHALNELTENPKPSAVQFDQFIVEKVKTFFPVAEAKGIVIKASIQTGKKILSEPNYLGRILDNLLSNAIKFSPRQSIIEVSNSWYDGIASISVKDAGPGFSADDEKLLYQKFKKLSARPTAGESSNGLGLAIVKTLVDRLNGTIELRTSRRGSEFLIRFPAGTFQEVPA